MTYTVYIIFSHQTNKFYIGQTEDFGKRLLRHNSGLVKSTKTGVPWKVIYTIACNSRSESMILESRIKSRGISRYLTDNNIAF